MTGSRVVISRATAVTLMASIEERSRMGRVPVDVQMAVADLALALDQDLIAEGEAAAWEPFRKTVRLLRAHDDAVSDASPQRAANTATVADFLHHQFIGLGLDVVDGATLRAALGTFHAVRTAAAEWRAAGRLSLTAAAGAEAVAGHLALGLSRFIPEEARS